MGRAWVLFADGSTEAVPEGSFHQEHLDQNPELLLRGSHAEVRLYPDVQGFNYVVWPPSANRTWLEVIQDDVLGTPATTVTVGLSPEIVFTVSRGDFMAANSFQKAARSKVAARTADMREDLDKKLFKKDFRQFLRDLRDLAQAAERRLSSRRNGSRVAGVESEDDLHDMATVAAYWGNRYGWDRDRLVGRLGERWPGLSGQDVDTVLRYARQFYGRRIPNPGIQESGRHYNQKHSLPPHRRLPYAGVDPAEGRKIADAFEALPSTPPDPATPEGQRSLRAYQAFAREVEQQFAHLPVRIEWWTRPGQPYQSSREVFEDIADHNHLWVFLGGDDHPFLSRELNAKFRAVHDYYGHAAHGFEFGPRGEENAWLAHSQMFSGEARPAMTAETRGQNNYVNWGPHGDHNRTNPEKTMFAPQKGYVLPDEFNQRPLEPFRFNTRQGRRRNLVARLMVASPEKFQPFPLSMLQQGPDVIRGSGTAFLLTRYLDPDGHRWFTWDGKVGHEQVTNSPGMLQALFGPKAAEITEEVVTRRPVYRRTPRGHYEETGETREVYDYHEIRRLAIQENLFGRYGTLGGRPVVMLWRAPKGWRDMTRQVLQHLNAPPETVVVVGTQDQFPASDFLGGDLPPPPPPPPPSSPEDDEHLALLERYHTATGAEKRDLGELLGIRDVSKGSRPDSLARWREEARKHGLYVGGKRAPRRPGGGRQEEVARWVVVGV
jgi:hypothetical protein